MTLYSLLSFVSRAMFSAAEYFVGQSVGVGATPTLSDVFYHVSGCEERDGLLKAVFGQCHSTNLGFRGATDGVIHNHWDILHLPSMLSGGLLPYLPLLPKECAVPTVLTPVKVYHVSHSPLIHAASPFIFKGGQFVLGKPASPFPDHILVLGACGAGCQEDTALR